MKRCMGGKDGGRGEAQDSIILKFEVLFDNS